MPRNVSKADKTVRCIALLIALARARRGVQLRPLFERRGWCWRSAYRDLETLRRAGVPIEQQERGWFRVADGWIPAGAIDAKREELAALLAARRLAPALRELEALWKKLCGPHQLALELDAWLDVRAPSIDYDRHRHTLETLKEAVRGRHVLEVHYRNVTGEESHRFLEPAFVRWESSVEAFYLIAWCRTRCAVRTFAVHRIVNVEPTMEAFVPRPDAHAEVRNAFRLWTGPSLERVSLRFSRHVAHEVRERRWHATATISDMADGGVRLQMEIAAPDELVRLLLGYGPEVLVEEPVTLAARIREIHAACAGLDRLDMRRAPLAVALPRRRIDTR